MTHMLQSRWLAVAVGVIAYGVTTVLSLQPHHLIQSQAETTEQAEPPPRLVPSWQFLNPEMDQLLKELSTERDNLRTRAQQLEEWQARLDAERQEMLTFTQKVFQLQAQMDRSITRIREDEVTNLKKLANLIIRKQGYVFQGCQIRLHPHAYQYQLQQNGLKPLAIRYYGFDF